MLVSRPADTADEGIAIDEMTARLLDGRFDVREGDEGLSLHGEREMAEGARLLLQKPTACVGRDRELSTLAQMFAECVEEPLAQAALVTGTAGMGKSRLAQEFLARLRVQGEPPAMWIGRGDSLRAGSALGLLGQALRGTCGIRGDEPLRERRDKLLSRVAQHVHPDHRQRVAELLGEVAGVPFPDDESHLLRAARRNTQIMTDEMRRAWVDFLRAETGVQPVLLVLEDLHWGDGATVRFIDAALRDLGERPWMVLALARPEVHALFPTLWADRRIQEIQIKPLSKKASERLVRQVLGAEIGADTAERIIAQADGNAFYLEELIRAAAEHQAETLPETVIAMVESRLAALEGEDRRALRAAAVFGEVFWPGGVATLLGSAERSAHVQARLLGLVEREVLVKRPDSRFAGELELAFRHVLLREGAYAMLTSDDRIVGHKRAGEWLERAGETDSKLLAEHFDRGGEVERAAAHYVRAADQALEGGDCEVAIKLTERGVTLGGEPELLAGLRAVEGEAKLRRGDLEGAYVAAGAALRFARPGSRTEGRALYSGILGAVNAGNSDLLREPAERLLHTYPEPDAITQVAAAFFSVVTSLTWQVKGDMAARYLRRLEEVTSIVMNHDPLVGVWVELTRSTHACHVERDFWGALKHAQRAAFYYEQSATRDVLPFGRSFIAFFCPLLGTFDHAEEEFSRALTTDHATAMETFNVQIYRGMMLIDQRKLDEASALLGRVLHELRPQAESLTRIVCRLHWTELQLYKGALEDAELEAIALQDLAGDHPYLGMWYLAVLACIRLAQGRAGEASEIAERAFAQSQACGMGYCCRHAMLLLVRAEAFHALGDQDAACQAIREARDDLLRRAAKIPDSEPEVRRCFLENLPDHRRTLELAREWLGEEGVARAGHLTDPR
jgi:tetratricopeptide (TPR) repeat protein